MRFSNSLMVAMVTTLLIFHSNADSCNIIKSYLGIVSKDNFQILKTDEARDSHRSIPSESTVNKELTVCSTEDTCCTKESEASMKEGSSDFFIAYSISLGVGKIEDNLTKLKTRVSGEIESVMRRTEGKTVSYSIMQYLNGQTNSVDDIINQRFLYFIDEIYNSSLDEKCLESLGKTKAVISERTQVLLDQYKRLLNEISEGVNRLKSLKKELVDALSPECISAVSKASMYAGVGCKMCKDSTKPVNSCYNLCLNVVRGCLRPLLCYAPEWREWADKLESITLELKNLANSRSNFVSRLVTEFENEYLELPQGKVEECLVDMEAKDEDKQEQLSRANGGISTNYFSQMSELGGELSDLPSKTCSSNSFLSPDSGEECWNGTHVGSYGEDIPKFDLQDQKCNPEVDPVRLICDIGSMTCDSYIVGTEEPTKAVTGAVKNSSVKIITPLYLLCMVFSSVML